jgi:uncharacterized membrane protein YfcA
VEWWLAYLAVGAVAGLLAGLLGVGGGIIVVPALAVVFTTQGIPPQYIMALALGTSLAAIVFTALASVRAHHAHGAVDWRIVWRITPGLVVGAFAGASIAARASSSILAVAFGLFLCCVATYLIIDGIPQGSGPLPGRLGLWTVGGAIGLVSGVMGIGGGTLTVPFLTWRRIRFHHAIGTAAAAGLPIAVAGALGYLLSGLALGSSPPDSVGFVHVPAFIGVTVTSVSAAPLGARLAHRLPTGPLRKVFGLFLYLAGGKLVLSVLLT